MTKRSFIPNVLFPIILLGLILSSFSKHESKSAWNSETPVYDVLIHLGYSKPDHYVEKINEDLVEQGRQIIEFGNIKGGKYVSKYYVCISCHNTKREDPDLRIVDQDARLAYAEENDLPYLQASTFWGIVNRETWYNDDYVKKYGDLVKKATNSLEESTQLCATVCSAGRGLESHEMKAVMHYFWSLQMKLGDLDLNEVELNRIYNAYSNPEISSEIIALIKSKYLQKSPATFSEAPKDLNKGYGLEGRPRNGYIIYKRSCQHCHRENGESDEVFDNSKLLFKWFAKNINSSSKSSIYNIIRYGTYSSDYHKKYMPQFTQEKMSDQQIEDLRAFIEMRATKN